MGNQGKKQNRWRRLIRKAANVLKRHQWGKNFEAMDSRGKIVGPTHPSACKFCITGALVAAHGRTAIDTLGEPPNQAKKLESVGDFKTNKVYYEAIQKLNEKASKLMGQNVMVFTWNDHVCKSQDEAVNLLLDVANGD
jgi:hypothetical protein